MVSKSLFFMMTPAVLAKTIQMNVGTQQNGLVFVPESVTASVGDMVEFAFYPRDHSVVQGDYNNGCQPLNGGFYSGYFPVSNGPGAQSFTITINNTDPIWLYCSQGSHCQSGMVGVINPPASGDTLAAYKTLSSKASSNAAGAQVQGGVVGAYMAVSDTGSMSSSMSSSVSSGTATMASTTVTSGTSKTTVAASKTSSTATGTASTTSGTAAATSAHSGAMGIKDSKSDIMAMIVALGAGLGAALLLA